MPAPHTTSEHDGSATADAVVPAGLQITSDGFFVNPTESILPAGRSTVAFTVEDHSGHVVTDFEVTHGKPLHLIAVRRDLNGYQHVHPTLDSTGTWQVPLDLTPGVWRLFADFQPSGGAGPMTLGVDVFVAGSFEPQAVPPPVRTAVVDDYEIALVGDLVAGQPSALTMTVTHGGQPVTDLEPYLEAFGHLVALREGDLAFQHVHPVGEPGDGLTAPGPEVSFVVTAASAGRYRLFLDFQHRGQVRTAEFTADATAPVSTDAAVPVPSSSSAGGDHGSAH